MIGVDGVPKTARHAWFDSALWATWRDLGQGCEEGNRLQRLRNGVSDIKDYLHSGREEISVFAVEKYSIKIVTRLFPPLRHMSCGRELDAVS